MQTKDLRLLNTKEVAKELGVNASMVRKIFHSKNFPVIRIGRQMFVQYDSLVKWISSAEKAN